MQCFVGIIFYIGMIDESLYHLCLREKAGPFPFVVLILRDYDCPPKENWSTMRYTPLLANFTAAAKSKYCFPFLLVLGCPVRRPHPLPAGEACMLGPHPETKRPPGPCCMILNTANRSCRCTRACISDIRNVNPWRWSEKTNGHTVDMKTSSSGSALGYAAGSCQPWRMCGLYIRGSSTRCCRC